MPQLRQLEYFVAVAETLNFRRAADRTNTTQPTLSEQIKALEERLGVRLFERTTSRVVITAAGAEVLEIAKRMLRDAAEIRAITARRRKELSGLLRLGLPPTIGPYLMQRAAPAIHAHHPDLKLYLREETPEALQRSLEDGHLDVIIAPLPIKSAEVSVHVLGREPLLVALGADHPLAKLDALSLADLEGVDILALGRGQQLHDTVAALCEEAGARLRHDFEGTSLDMLREMVIMGLGITFMPGLYAARELVTDPHIALRPLKGRDVSRPIAMAWRTSSGDADALTKLASFFKPSFIDILPKTAALS